MTRRLSGRIVNGAVVARNTGAPSGVVWGSTAILRPGVSGTPCAPVGPAADPGISRKNTYAGFRCNNGPSFAGFLAAHCLMPCMDALSTDSSPRSTNIFPTDTYG